MKLNRRLFVARILLLLTSLVGFSAAQAAEVQISVVDKAGNPVNGFKWLLQEDTTYGVDPFNPGTQPEELLSLGFHRSYHPIARSVPAAGGEALGLSGNSDLTSNTVTISDLANPAAGTRDRYYVSILPFSGYGMSGAPVVIDQAGANAPVTVVVQAHPIPTAQISVYLFHDNYPINAAPDLPEETNPEVGEPGHVDWTQFSIIVEEPAGRYGIAGGQVIQDAFGNPLGTTYNPDGTVATPGDGTLAPDSNGFLTIKNLAPGKYGIVAIPPTASGWQQTSTIEGTKTIDAWVKANEPPFFVEFGLPGPHVFIGFVKSSADWVLGEPGGFPPLQPPEAGQQTATVTGLVTDMHNARPPKFEFSSGRPFPDCWIGINDASVGRGKGIYASPCEADSSFSVPDLAPGDYTLKVFDANMDVVIATMGFSVNENGGHCDGLDAAGNPVTPNCAYGEVPVFNWFTRLNAGIFNDVNQNGFWDDGEAGIGPESQDVSVRWRDGTIYQNFPTDGEGLAPFDELFPFFHWLVAEVSFPNKKATGATFVTDEGGPVDTTTDQFPGFGELTPMPQICTVAQSTNPDDPDSGCTVGAPLNNPNTPGDNRSRTEVGPVLTAGFQGFLGQTNVMQFGKADYLNFDFSAFPPTFVGENGGISGIVFSSTTRAEDEPRFAAAEEWEPGVPRVQVTLYADGDIDSFPISDWPNGVGDVDWNGDGIKNLDDDIIDDVNGNGLIDLADVDNHPLDNFPGAEDVDHNGNGVFDLGDAIQVTWTDSWDDNLPTGCQGDTFFMDGDPSKPTDCFDGLRNFNQVRPAVFDGGYAFTEYDLGHIGAVQPGAAAAIQGYYDAIMNSAIPDKELLQLGMLPGDYIVTASAPPGYETMREEHKNVDFGDTYIPSTQAFAPNCVGEGHLVPDYLSHQTAEINGSRVLVVDPAEAIAAPFANTMRPLCDRKKVPLSSAQNAAADFFLATEVPAVGNVSGVILNDVANEFNPNSPAFGEKYAPPLVPVGFYDWEGNLVNKVYADQYGRYNAVVPSTYTANLPIPSGMSPNMLTACMNDSAQIANPEWDPANPDEAPEFITDPFFDAQYSQFCYTFQYMPGAITYLDTPVVPVGAFTGPGQFPVDCEHPHRTPMIASVKRRNADGGGGPFVLPGQRIRIRSMGRVSVPNPEWDGLDLADKTIRRNYRFGGSGATARLIAADGAEYPLTINSANGGRIFATVPTNVPAGNYQVIVTRNAGVPEPTDSPIGVTLTVGEFDSFTGRERGVRPNGAYYDVISVSAGESIQTAINGANPGDLILVGPGEYDELVIMWKPVKLQGWGAGEVTINARQVPTEKITGWRDTVRLLDDAGLITRLLGQQLAPFGFAALAETLFPTEEGAGVFVVGIDAGPDRFGALANRGARVDGFTILGASSGGGIIVNGYAQDLSIGNNRLTSNFGFNGGGIRVGHPNISHEILNADDPNYNANNPNAQVGDIVYDDAFNDRIRIHHNHVARNGGNGGAGGGISLYTGSDAYRVQENFVCGNFSAGDGGGIGHLGRSRGGLIEDNVIVFNESFSQANAQSGGGIFIGGQPALTLEAATDLLLSPGSGNVTVDSNLIRGNLAGAGDGGGIRVSNVNGHDVAQNPTARGPWYAVGIYNNMINNNVAGLAGGGLSIGDSLKVLVRNNTVANNDSVATAALAFTPGETNRSNAQPAGIVSRAHSTDMRTLMTTVVDAGALPGSRATQWQAFSDPTLRDTIVYQNRSFFWSNYDDPATAIIENGLLPATCDTPASPSGNPNCEIGADPTGYVDDLAVIGATGALNPRVSLLTDTTGYHSSNVSGDPGFINSYFNEARNDLLIPEFTVLQTALAFDEGGNFIQVQYGPLSLLDPEAPGNPATNTTLLDYHIAAPSAALDAGGNLPNNPANRLRSDIDNDPRPDGGNDIGADEAQ